MLKNNLYPFTAVVGQEEAKKALLIALVNRRAGGLLIGGAKGMAKSVLARSVQSLIGAQKLLTLPLNVTEDMLFGSIDLEAAVSLGEKRFSPGILARATDNILYIDEANLLRQELLTAALDANSAGINNVERDGISCSHEVRTTVIATMNPEEGTLPGHILDRFGMYADMQALQDIGQRVEVIQRALAYSNNTLAFCEQYAEETAALAAKGFDAADVATAKTGTMAYNIMQAHNTSGDAENLKIKFDAMASHDITFVGIIQTARASGLEKFPIPYVLTNCHNSLCAVGGTINEDDHRFGLSAAKKYGGIFVPPHMAVIHQYMRERFAGCGKMILGSDSHTRYGALGTMAIGEGGGELAKQLLGRTYDVARPGVVAIYLTGSLPAGCGPHDVAIALVGKLFKSGYVKNKVMEFVGPGIASLRQDTRNAIDAMTTETTCLSSIWETDEVTQRFLAVHGRAADYKKLAPADLAYYDGVVEVDLSAIRPMIALPMHPSNAFTIEELNANLEDILHACEQDVQKLIGRKDVQLDLCSKIENGKLRVDQGVIAGCAGGLYDSIYEAASILKGHTGGCGDYALSVYPGSQPIMMELVRTGVIGELMASGATIRTAFCGPCFGAGDVPANGALSIRHTTRNFPSREGSKPGSGQLAGVALMDARSIAATTANGGILTPATDIDYDPTVPEYQYDASSYDTRVYQGFGKGDYDALLKLGPNIKDWPEIAPLGDNLC